MPTSSPNCSTTCNRPGHRDRLLHGRPGGPGVRPALPAAPGRTGGAQQRVQPHPRAERRGDRPRRASGEQGPDANVDAALERWFSREYKAANPAQVAAIRQVLASNDPQGYHTTYSLFATQDMYRADDLGSIQVPTLIATGELDSGSTPAMTRQLAAAFPVRTAWSSPSNGI
jgi:pimeloyl-ACP methyl ester carboxylesterase